MRNLQMYLVIVDALKFLAGSLACLVCRPDLGEILDGQSAIFAVDYFADHTPRSNVAAKLTFEGTLTVDLLKERVKKYWLSSKDGTYDRLQQRPFKWMGFTFWKDCRDTFSLERHVHRIFEKEVVTAEQVTDFMEKLLNRPISRDRSPWAFYVIENYHAPNLPGADGICGAGKKQSVLLFNCHHCLLDATGLFMSLVDGLFEGYSFSELGRARPQKMERTLSQTLWFYLTFPINAFIETAYIMSHYVSSSPLSIPDHKKDWHQVLSTVDEVVPVKLIKDVKNHFGVSYTSVVLSAISGAVYRMQGVLQQKTGVIADSVLCLSMLPAKGISNRRILANHMTGAVFDFPIGYFDNPVHRLKAVDQTLEKNRNSVVPYLAQFLTTLCGAHLFLFNKLLVKNRLVPTSLSNFAGLPTPLKFTEDVHWVFMDGATGCFDGETGLFIVCCSIGQHSGITMVSERGLLTKSQLQQLVTYMQEELQVLEGLII